jgi:hypothetical protein
MLQIVYAFGLDRNEIHSTLGCYAMIYLVIWQFVLKCLKLKSSGLDHKVKSLHVIRTQIAKHFILNTIKSFHTIRYFYSGIPDMHVRNVELG